MLDLSPHEYAIYQQRQHRVLRYEEWNERELRERLATDPIAAWMRTLRCDLCGCPVVSCQCRDEDLPFCDAREVKE